MRQRPRTGSFHIPVRTVRPFHTISRGSPTFTDSNLAKFHRVRSARSRGCGSLLFGQQLGLRFSVRKETHGLALCPARPLLGAADVPVGSATLQYGAQVQAQLLLHRRPPEEPVAVVDLV